MGKMLHRRGKISLFHVSHSFNTYTKRSLVKIVFFLDPYNTLLAFFVTVILNEQEKICKYSVFHTCKKVYILDYNIWHTNSLLFNK